MPLVAVVAGLVFGLVRDLRSRQYHVSSGALSGWTVVLGRPDDPWVVALEPPASMAASLLQQASNVDRRLAAPPHAALPLVTRQEYDDALQGVFGAADIQRMARQTITSASIFEPVCIGHRVDRKGGGSDEIYFLAVTAPEFDALRLELRPDFPEHAGIGAYDAGALTAVLPFATTGTDFVRWWPIRLERLTDCQGQVVVD